MDTSKRRGTKGELNCIAEPDGPTEPARQIGERQPGSQRHHKQDQGDRRRTHSGAARWNTGTRLGGSLLVRRPVAGSKCAAQHLLCATVGQEVQERLWRPSRTAYCCPLAIEEVDESGEVLLLPLLSEPSSDLEMIETAL